MAESTPFINASGDQESFDNIEYTDKEEMKHTVPRGVLFSPKLKDLALSISVLLTVFLLMNVALQRNSPLLNGRPGPGRVNLCKYKQIVLFLILNAYESPVTADVDQERLIPMRFYSDYSSVDASGMRQVDLNWDAINSEHGIVALDHEWAAEKGLPRAQDLPSDPSKGVYSLEAYHALLCLVSKSAADRGHKVHVG